MSVYVAGGGASVVVPAGAAGPWTPASLASLAAWWDFSDASKLFIDAGTTPVSADGQAIYQANDKSGHGFHMVQATAGSRPLYKTGVINGLSIGLFDGGDDWLSSALVTAAIDNFCMVVLAQETGPTPNCILYNGDAGATGYGPSDRTSGHTKGFLFGGIAFYDSAITADTNWTLYLLRRSSGTNKLYFGGGAAVSTNSVTPLAGASVTQLGRATGGYNFGGRIADAYFLLGDTVAEVNLLGAYLATKWGLTWSDVS